jgi:glycosyltransferase involved in cell wall biosynthesis
MNFIPFLARSGNQAESPRRVLQVITPSHMSGAEMQLVRLTHRMRDRGHQISTVIKRSNSAVEEMRRLGLEVDDLPIGGKLNIAALAILAHRARQTRAQIVQSTLSTASWWCGWLDRLGGPPSVGHVQGFTSARWHRHQTHLLAVSQAVKDDLVRQGVAADRITVMHNALAPEEFRPTRDPLAVRSEFGADADTPVVGTFAHLSEKKGHRELFQAIPEILRKCPRTQFWIVGQGALRQELEASARRFGFLPRIRFLGYRRDVPDLMNTIDAMVLPSHREPCALVYVEAALSKKPIIACRAGGAPESVADGQTGLLVPVRDSSSIAAAVIALLADRGYGQRLGQAGYERALDLFGWERCVRTLEGVYGRVLDQHGRHTRPTARRAA